MQDQDQSYFYILALNIWKTETYKYYLKPILKSIESKHSDICIPIFIVLFTIDKEWKQVFTDEWIDKQNMVDSAFKRK